MFESLPQQLPAEEGGSWWLSVVYSSVAEHWLHNPGVLGSIPCDYRPFCFLLKTSSYLLILSYQRVGRLSICRDGADVQYMQYLSNYHNCKVAKPAAHKQIGVVNYQQLE